MLGKPLFKITREDICEIEISGVISLVGVTENPYLNTELREKFPARSILKPFQFLAADIPISRWENTALPDRYTAALGSVSATAEQVKTLQKWHSDGPFRKLAHYLKVPSGYPLDSLNRALLKERKEDPSPSFHMCFSKHMSILEACEIHHWDFQRYTSTDHPFHSVLLKTLSKLLKKDLSNTPFVTDGCGLPTPVLYLEDFAKLYQLLSNADKDHPLYLIRQKMLSHPEWIGGPDRVDTLLMKANPGILIAKEGADGLLAIGILPNERFKEGIGLVVKIASGMQMPYASLAINPILRYLDLNSIALEPSGQRIEYTYDFLGTPKNKMIDISPTLNTHTAVWPGDKPLTRQLSKDVDKGDNYTLSDIQTTLHIGSHADAPIHFKSQTPGIDGVNLNPYYGPAQVIHLNNKRNTLITPEDLFSIEINAPRILFRTDSFPDPNQFNEDFVALSSHVVDYLADKGVFLIGLDTASIDPFSSKDLPAHHATVKRSVSILEGLCLKEVKPSIYTLIALPLKIEGADASPVRAVLVKS